MDMQDSLGRRKRQRRPSTPTKVMVLTLRDLMILETLQRHGPSTVQFFYEFTKHLAKDFSGLQERLTKLFDCGYIRRPKQQWNTFHAEGNYIVYEITDKGLAVLPERPRVITRDGDHWKHDVALSFISQSIHLAVLQEPEKYEFIYPDEASDHLSFALDNSTLQSAADDLKIKLPPNYKLNLTPDRIFGIRYKKSGVTRIFFLEFSRSKQTNKSKSLKKKTHHSMMLAYHAFIGKGAYRKWFTNNERAVVLHLFNSKGQMKNILEQINEVTKGTNFMLFKTWNTFGEVFKPPAPKLDLFTEPWNRPGRPPFSLTEV